MTIPQKIRTRFAPSPTGYPHIGNIWLALMQWLAARHTGGTFVLRVEDTDRTRFMEGAEARMIEALQWYGITHDEGPDIGGPKGPYRQSERLDIYQMHAQELIEAGNAYYCFCSPERLEELRKEQQAQKLPPRYDGRCRHIPVAEALRRLHEPHVVRIKFPQDGETTFIDIIRGEVTFRNSVIDDQVLLKSDGWPTYHLAVVVDDHYMEINTVIRGEEWLSSTPKHLVLYGMLNWQPPQFAHMPLILAPDRSKLSKRHGNTDALLYRSEGFLSDAIINFLALLGWNPKTTQEFFSRDELTHLFSLTDMNKAGAVFDRRKLLWFNQHYLRRLSDDELVAQAKPFIATDDASQAVVRQAILANRDRAQTLRDFDDLTSYFFHLEDYEKDLLRWKQMDTETTKQRLKTLHAFVQPLPTAGFGESELEQKIKQFIGHESLSIGEVLWPMRVALSGRKESCGPFTIAAVIGKEETLQRLEHAINLLR